MKISNNLDTFVARAVAKIDERVKRRGGQSLDKIQTAGVADVLHIFKDGLKIAAEMDYEEE